LPAECNQHGSQRLGAKDKTFVVGLVSLVALRKLVTPQLSRGPLGNNFMKIKHRKKYYVGGFISLIFLPILFFLSTTEIRQKAINYGSIEVNAVPDGATDRGMLPSPPESLYVFIGGAEETKLFNFQQFCQTKKERSRTILKVDLPENCNYGFVVRVIDILHCNNYECGIDHRTIRFNYRPDRNYQPEYEPASTAEEFQYLYTKFLLVVANIKEYFADEPVHKLRILKYSDLGPPSGMYGSIDFTTNSKIKEEPKSSYYFRVYDSWFIPIILLWLLLFILSIRRNRKLLPNQALKLTE
jgi:hypothetical protein